MSFGASYGQPCGTSFMNDTYARGSGKSIKEDENVKKVLKYDRSLLTIPH